MGFLENIASDTKAVMEWWAPVFNTMEELRVKLPDDSHATGEFMSENDIKISLRYIREAMDLYYREVSIMSPFTRNMTSDFTLHLVWVVCEGNAPASKCASLSVGTGYHI